MLPVYNRPRIKACEATANIMGLILRSLPHPTSRCTVTAPGKMDHSLSAHATLATECYTRSPLLSFVSLRSETEAVGENLKNKGS